MKRGQFKYSIPMSLLDTSRSTMMQGAVLDMMRYDAARVVEWSSDRTAGALVLQSETFTRDRWLSFGINPTLISDMA